jgi:hypothetical protein
VLDDSVYPTFFRMPTKLRIVALLLDENNLPLTLTSEKEKIGDPRNQPGTTEVPTE